MTYNPREIDSTIKWLKQRMTKAIHLATDHNGPVWAKGAWRPFVFDHSHWNNTMNCIERHNERRGEDRRPYPFLTIA